MEEIVKRIDDIVKDITSTLFPRDTYITYIVEIKQLVISIAGENSELFHELEGLSESQLNISDKCKGLIGIVNGLKDYIQVLQLNRKYQVFISSTYQDLKEYRSRIADDMAFNGYIVAGMENFYANGDNLENYLRNVIDESDYYVLIIGQRWGTSLPGDENTSYTMFEYNYAKNKGMKIIPLIYNGDEDLPESDLGINKDKFKAFVKEINKTVPKYFKNKEELSKEIIKSLHKETSKHPQKGWIRL